MQIHAGPVKIMSFKGGFWFRLFGYGLSVNDIKPTFSERNGYRKSIRLPMGYKATFLRP